jgi:hypothetical protein
MKAVFAQEIGTRVSLRKYWGDKECDGWIHNAKFFLWDIPDKINENHFGGDPEDYPEELWQVLRCEKCGQPAPADAKRQVNNQRLYDTPSGKPEPGSIYWADWYPDNMFWDNHKGPHLLAVLPNGWIWVIDSRASNCTLPEDRLHRCWCRHGEVPDITVDKNGITCSAGAGSISGGDWHGFLRNGEFVK